LNEIQNTNDKINNEKCILNKVNIKYEEIINNIQIKNNIIIKGLI
jgi:hypothetical protein